MPSTRILRPIAIASVWSALTCTIVQADERPPTAAISSPEIRHRVPRPPTSKTSGSTSESAGGWWLGSVGIVAALAVFGGVSLASKRFLPNRESGPIQVVGRSSLSPKHSVYLLRVGDRVLIVGTGPQGAPSALGEVTDPAELTRLIPRKTVRPGPEPVEMARTSPLMAKSTGFDRRIGDDE
jgi:flagellar protein FliO/FliZ